ncbi:GD22245 [Drosophila simulans]|uniref:GD22245 n=1 Tax=Drosophila simulans TaxID=7240 RepID=B4Q9C8_DROSI|nr:GD22245 [Drosophila simulans]
MIDTPGARRLNDSRGSGLGVEVAMGMSMSLPRPLSAGVKTTPRGCDISGHVQQLVATHGRSPQTDMPMETGHAAGHGEQCIEGTREAVHHIK